MQAAAKCMKQLYKDRQEDADRRIRTLSEVREEVFLHVYAPVVMEYVEWVLAQACREGKERLYFLARDGWLPYLAARRLSEERGLRLAIRYLKLSRLAVRNALLALGGRESDVAARDCFDQTIAYFRQEGLFEDVPYVLADSGWIGSMQYDLQRLLRYAAGKPVSLQGYYFGLYARPKGTMAKQYRHFYFGEKNVRRKIRFSNCLLEAVCSSPQGMIRGYRPMAGTAETGVEAVESGGGNPNAKVMERFAELMSLYTEIYLDEERKGGLNRMRARRASAHMTEKLLQPMMGNPTRAEAEAFGSLLFSDDMWEERLQPVAAVWNEEDLYRQRLCNRLPIKMGIKNGVIPESAWREGSIVRLGLDVQKYIRQERLYKGLAHLGRAVCK